MAYANVGSDRTWVIPAHSIEAPQIVEIAIPTTKTFVAFDFSAKLRDPVVAIASVAAPTETGSKTITLADQALDPSNRMVSFSVAAMAVGDYEIQIEATLSEETGNEITGRGLLRVV